MAWNADKLRTLRTERGWTQTQAAHVIGCSLRVLQGWEAGKPVGDRYSRILDDVAAETHDLTDLSPAQLRALTPRVLPLVDDGQLIAEIARRFADRGASHDTPPPGPDGFFRFRRSDPTRAADQPTSNPDTTSGHAEPDQQ